MTNPADLTPAQAAEVDRLFAAFPGTPLARAIAEGRARASGCDPFNTPDDMALVEDPDAATTNQLPGSADPVAVAGVDG